MECEAAQGKEVENIKLDSQIESSRIQCTLWLSLIIIISPRRGISSFDPIFSISTGFRKDILGLLLSQFYFQDIFGDKMTAVGLHVAPLLV